MPVRKRHATIIHRYGIHRIGRHAHSQSDVHPILKLQPSAPAQTCHCVRPGCAPRIAASRRLHQRTSRLRRSCPQLLLRGYEGAPKRAQELPHGDLAQARQTLARQAPLSHSNRILQGYFLFPILAPKSIQRSVRFARHMVSPARQSRMNAAKTAQPMAPKKVRSAASGRVMDHP